MSVVDPQLAGRDVEREEDVLAGLVAGLRDGLEHDVQRLAVGLQAGREAAFVADAGGVALLLQDAAQRVEDLRARPQGFANDEAPSGMTMNSWKSTLLSACAPPFRMFIIGTGRMEPVAPSRFS